MEIEKMVGAKLPQDVRDDLAFVLTNNGTTFKGQLTKWIKNEKLKIILEKGGAI